MLLVRRKVRIITNFPAVIRFDYPLTYTQRIVCLSEDNLRTEDYLLSITRLFYPTKRFLNNSYTHTGVGSCRAITSDVFRNEQANQSTVYPTSDCYLSVPGKDLFLFNTQIKVSEKLNIESRETLFVQDP